MTVTWLEMTMVLIDTEHIEATTRRTRYSHLTGTCSSGELEESWQRWGEGTPAACEVVIV